MCRSMYATREACSGAFSMSFTPATETEVPALTPPAAAAAARKPEDVEYPEGNWIAQSVWHGDAVSQAAVALKNHFSNREDVLVAMELVVYYECGNDKVCLQPDVQVVFGVQRGNRSSYKVWEEGKAADFVLEVASPSTADKDARHKAQEYARIGVREYWRLDPTGSLLATPLEGWEANGGGYHPAQAVASGARGGWLRSRALGLELRSQRQDGATVLVFRDPLTGEEFNGDLGEAERLRRAAEERASAEAKLRQSAEELASAEAKRASAEAKRASVEAERRRAAEERANAEAKSRRAAEERARALEKQLRTLATESPSSELKP